MSDQAFIQVNTLMVHGQPRQYCRLIVAEPPAERDYEATMTDDVSGEMPVLPEGTHLIDVPLQEWVRAGIQAGDVPDAYGLLDEPDRDHEWIVSHIRKLENAVDDILFALRAGGYQTIQVLPSELGDPGFSRNEEAVPWANSAIERDE